MGLRKNHNLVQASMYKLPFKKASFDKVFCLGVLQHTPDPKKSFFCLTEMAKEKKHKDTFVGDGVIVRVTK